ncbi:MAG TPA: superoxide dismutase [Cu-Zn] SodC [Caulobacteraceae bacterium]|nr:superoxide dismutase [Cu-Zn] SodC [Caulobacteraceae bacterium]
MTYRQFLASWVGIVAIALGPTALAKALRADMALATPDGPGAPVGTVTIDANYDGARIVVDLHGLPPGQHGFHVHVNGSCAPGPINGVVGPAGAAGSHFDPEHNGAHMGPMGFGHLGDLPVLTVGADGSAHATLIAPRVRDIQAFRGHALVIHAGGDNYSDDPQPLGGGGARIACGVLG